MDYSIWQGIIIFIGCGLALISLLCAVWPQRLIAVMPYAVKSKPALYGDIIVRLLLGVSLIIAADTSGFPLAFLILGVLSLIAAILIAILGRMQLEKIVLFFAKNLSVELVRIGCLLGILFGAFLVYGVK